MSNPGQTDLPPISERFQQANTDYQTARAAAIQSLSNGRHDEAQVWATLAAAAATVLAEPIHHCSKCCF